MKQVSWFVLSAFLMFSILGGAGARKTNADGPALLPDTMVSPASDSDPRDEPSVAISPLNSRIMFAASKDMAGGVASPNQGTSRVAYYFSSDGGATWGSGLVPTPAPFNVSSDPTVAVDTQGNFYLCVLMLQSTSFNNGVFVFESTDGGRTLDPPITVFSDINDASPKLCDKPFITIDTSPTSEFENSVYVAWVMSFTNQSGTLIQEIQFAFMRASDSGFSGQQNISHSGTIFSPSIATGPNGEVYGVFEGIHGIQAGAADSFLYDASLDGGVTFYSAIGNPPGHDAPLYFFNGTLSPPQPAISIPGVSRVNSFPTLDVDRSNGPNRGTVYIAWPEVKDSPTNSDIYMMTVQPANGQHPVVSGPVVVKPSGSNQFFPSLSVDASDGAVSIAFYDQTGSSGVSINPYLTRSTDGGHTFSTAQKLSSAASDPTVQTNVKSANGETIGIGDYMTLVAANGHDSVIWTDTRNNKQEIFIGGVNFGGAPPPPAVANDSCQTPHVIASPPFTDSLDTTQATSDPSDPQLCSGTAGSNTVWYSLTPAASTVIGVDTSAGNYDTVLAVFTGPCGALTQIACNDDFGNQLGNKSMLTFQAATGVPYLIEVAGKGTGGTLGLRVGYPTVTSISYGPGPDGTASLQIQGAGFVANNARVIVQVNGVDNILPNTFFTGSTLGDGTVTSISANRRKLKKLVKPGLPILVRVESPVGSGLTSVPLSFTR